MMRTNKTQRLQAMWDSDPQLAEAAIRYQPFYGWVIDFHDPRYFGDEGDWLGRNFEEAKRYLEGITRQRQTA